MIGRLLDPSLESALLRYRLMAYVVGTLLMVLVFVAVPLQYAADQPAPAAVIGVIHGICYIVYLLTSYDLVRKAGWRWTRLVAPVFAGFIPVLAFVVERRTTRRLREGQRLAGTTWPTTGGRAGASA